MIIPIEKLFGYDSNKYIFTKAAMKSIDKVGNMRGYPEKDTNWKVVPNVLKLLLNEEVKYKKSEEIE